MDSWAESSPANFQIAQSELQRLNAGLLSTAPNAETIVNSTNQSTAMPFLQQLQTDGVNWDITGYHAYTVDGNIYGADPGETLSNAASLGKPIYITEFNSVAQQYDIIGANAYELCNQPENGASPESQFRVLNSSGGTTETSDAITAWMNSDVQTT
ncbi:unnamed protein product [Sphagnum balticum]